MLVDQHAADERIAYEELCERLPRGDAQVLADPVDLELTAEEATLFDGCADALAGLGFYASRVDGGDGIDSDGANDDGDGSDSDEAEGGSSSGDGIDGGAPGSDEREPDKETNTDTNADTDAGADRRTVQLTTVPAAVAGVDPTLLCDVLAGFVWADHPQRTIDAAADALLADLACYPAITGNTSLSAGSVMALLSQLDDCENPYACPHGRPVVIEFGSGESAAQFERDYPGHGGRRSG